jgi:hypothetical protein
MYNAVTLACKQFGYACVITSQLSTVLWLWEDFEFLKAVKLFSHIEPESRNFLLTMRCPEIFVIACIL